MNKDLKELQDKCRSNLTTKMLEAFLKNDTATLMQSFVKIQIINDILPFEEE